MAQAKALPIPVTPAERTGDNTVALPMVTVSDQRTVLGEAPPAFAAGQIGRAARLGVQGNVSVMETPFSVTSYTSQTIENGQAKSVADLLAADPSVRMATARNNINEDLTVRGFQISTIDFAINGMFGLSPVWRAPLESMERVEVLKGPSSALFGVPPYGSIGGVVNLVPKRATSAGNTNVKVEASSDSLIGAHVDIGRRFGKDDAFGVRLNVMHRDGDTSINKQSRRDSLGSLGLDFRQARFRASVDFLWNEERIDNVVRQFQVGPQLAHIPRAPSGKYAYPGLGWTDGRSTSGLLKAEYDITDEITVFAGYGRRKQDWEAFAANPVLLNTKGDYTFFGGLQNLPVDTNTTELGLRSAFKLGGVSHNVTFGYNRLKSDQQIAFNTRFAPGASNIYAGRNFPTPSTAGVPNPLLPYRETYLTSYVLTDTLGLMQDRVLLTLGVRRQTIEGQSYNFMTGVPTGPYYDKSATTPVAGIVFKLRPSVALYASYVEGLSKGDTAPVSAAISNPGIVLPPYKTKQKELGVKFDLGKSLATVSVFEQKKPSAGLSGNTFGVFGEKRNRGVEATFAGEVGAAVRLLGGVTYTDSVVSKAVNPALQGKDAIGVAKWQVSLGGEWDASFIPGLTLSARALHTDRAAVDAANKLYVPSWRRLDAGLRYVTKITDRNVTFRANVENFFNKNYWGVSTAGYMYVGSPRTFHVSIGVDI